MTWGGGANNDGTIFSIPTAGGTPTTLFSFDGTHGQQPDGNLTLIGSTLYGMAPSNTGGVVFSIPTTGGTPTILASFSAATGQEIQGSLTLSADGSTFYGMASAGGANHDGTIFSVPVAGGPISVLASFNGTNGARSLGRYDTYRLNPVWNDEQRWGQWRWNHLQHSHHGRPDLDAGLVRRHQRREPLRQPDAFRLDAVRDD